MAEHASEHLAPEIKGTPLTAWLWTTVFCVAISLGIFEWFVRVGPPGLSAFEVHNQSRIAEFRERSATADLRIVMLGNSRLKYATFGDDLFSDWLSEESGLRVEVLRIVNNWAVFSDFDELVEPVEALEPDIIVLQSQLFGQQRAVGARSLVLQDYIDWIVQGTDKPWNPGDIDQVRLQDSTPCTNDFSDTALENRLARSSEWLSFDIEGYSGRKTRNWVARLAGESRKIVILSIPRTKAMEAASGSRLDALTRPVIEELTNHPRISYAAIPDSFSKAQFCDFVHLNDTGRKAFSGWLGETLLHTPGG